MSKVAICSSQRAVRVPRKKIRELIAFVERAEGVGIAEVDLAVVGRREIAELNVRYLGHAGATDVLSFDMSGESGAEGISAQIVVCGEVVAEQARLWGNGVQREMLLYVVHGLLHLMGYEDRSVRGAARMHAREEKLLCEFERDGARRRRRGRQGGQGGAARSNSMGGSG